MSTWPFAEIWIMVTNVVGKVYCEPICDEPVFHGISQPELQTAINYEKSTKSTIEIDAIQV